MSTKKVTNHYRKPFWVASSFLVVIIVLELISILWLNSGHFTFTLDDAYIHLALAENIVQGHYGVNLSEFSAPSSSILWPFLIAPFSRTSISIYLVLIINSILAIGTLFLFWKILLPLPDNQSTPVDKKQATLLTVLLIILIPATNMIGLIYTGMEHSAQVFLATMIVAGMIYEIEHENTPWWFITAIIMAPLIRYENLALSLPALFFLFFRGYKTKSLLAAGLVLFSLSIFSFFLVNLGLAPFPSSIIAKSSVIASGGKLNTLVAHLFNSLTIPQGVLLIVGIVLLIYPLLNNKLESGKRFLAFAISISVLIHLLGGEYGWYYRYEIYIWTSLILTLLYLNKSWIYRLPKKLGAHKATGFILLSGVLLGAPYVIMLLMNPLAANIIYKQQYQLHRFATEYYLQPVAVNDLGYVSYQNDNYVLDLWGLGSIEALEMRQNAENSEWMSTLTNQKNVKLAMIYDDWFSDIPKDWHKIGELSFTKLWLPPSKVSVSFYSVDCNSYSNTLDSIERFRPTLPKGVKFQFAPSTCQ